jgi:hypothetical protein
MNQTPSIKPCHSDRSIAIGFINRNAEWRNLLWLAALCTQGPGH